MNACKISLLWLFASSAVLGQSSSITLGGGAGFGQIQAEGNVTYDTSCLAYDGEGEQVYGSLSLYFPQSPQDCFTLDQQAPSITCYSEDYVPPGQYTITGSYSGFTGTQGDGTACTVPGANASKAITVPKGVPEISLNEVPAPTLQVGQVFSLQVFLNYVPSDDVVDNPALSGSMDLNAGTQILTRTPLGPNTGTDGSFSYSPTINAPTKGLQPGKYMVYAAYSGDATYASAQTYPFTVTLLPAQLATTTSLAVTPNPTVTGQPTSISVTVTPTGTTVPSGTVALLANGAQIGTIALVKGSGSIDVPANIGAGTYQIQAIYSGDGFNITSNSAQVSVTVDAQTTTNTAVTVTPSTLVAGAAAQLSATVTPAISNVVPTGTVTISANGSPVAVLQLNHGTGSEQVSTAGLPAGTYSVVGKYSGSAVATASTSPTDTVTIAAASSVSVTTSPNPVTQGSVTTLDATVKNGSGGLVTSGSVAFSCAGNSLGTANVGSNGQASLPIGTGSFAKGTTAITATFGGSGSVPAASGTVNLVVN